jgi:predicted nucleic acid-binding protein
MISLILDASVIIGFMTEMDDGEYLYALTLTGYSLIVTEGVIVEVKKEPGRSRLAKAVKEKWIKVEPTSKAEFQNYKILYPMLDYAEIEVLQYGLELKSVHADYQCVIDEGPGRKIADQLGLQKIGTEGLLNRMNHLGIIDELTKEKLLNKLDESPFRRYKPNRDK